IPSTISVRSLANLTPECIVRDHTGYLWVGTQNGLFRYDGIAFRRFGRADGIQGETIASLHVTRSGELWAGTNQGLFRFDGRQFQRISLPAQIHSIEANAIVSDRNGVVYAGTDAGLAAGNTATGFRLIAPIGRQTVTSGVPMNLLANALKFTERGEVVVQVNCEACSATNKTYRFRVRDTGIGIPPELREHILFEAFQQGDGSVSRKYGGAGLGLSISSQLVAIMGGVLRVDSEIDQGSTFEFSVQFPIVKDFEETGSRSAAAGDSADCDPLDILVVEDNSVNRRVIEGVLVRLGHGVTLAEDGIEAERILADREFQLAFLDVQMPVMDGLELTKRIREREAETGDHLPVVALTASAMKGDREMCFACGMDDYLSKPINFEHLRTVVAKHQRAAKRTATSER